MFARGYVEEKRVLEFCAFLLLSLLRFCSAKSLKYDGKIPLCSFVDETDKNKVLDLPIVKRYRCVQMGEDPAELPLNLVCFDEIDALCRRRGSLSGDTSGVRDSVVNQVIEATQPKKRQGENDPWARAAIEVALCGNIMSELWGSLVEKTTQCRTVGVSCARLRYHLLNS